MGGKLKLRKRIKTLQEIQKMENSDVPYTTSAIAKKLEVSKATVSNYRKVLRKEGLIKDKHREMDTGGDWMFVRSLFDEIPCIQKFITRCQLDELVPTEYTNRLYDICTVKAISPEKLIEGTLEDAEKIYSDFTAIYKKRHPELMMDRYHRAIRKFLIFNRMSIPPNSKVMPSGTDSSGDYSRVRLTDLEVLSGIKFLENNYGSEWATLFGTHHEIFARPATMLNWSPNIELEYAEVDGKSYEYASCSVFEKKTKKHFDKLIIQPKIIKRLSELNQNKNLITGEQKAISTKYASMLRTFYIEIGKIEKDIKYKKGVEGWLYYNRPIYAIRHSAAVMWMRRTAFNLELVSKMGWDDTKTLSKYYARTTVKKIMQAGTCYYCRPPQTQTAERLFCSATHALAYLNGARK